MLKLATEGVEDTGTTQRNALSAESLSHFMHFYISGSQRVSPPLSHCLPLTDSLNS